MKPRSVQLIDGPFAGRYMLATGCSTLAVSGIWS